MFSIPFVLSLITLNFLHKDPYSSQLLSPLMMIAMAMALIFFVIKKYTLSIFFSSLAISLLLGFMFVQKKETHSRLQDSDICSREYVRVRGELLGFPEIGNRDSVILLKASAIIRDGKESYHPVVLRINVSGDLRRLSKGDTIEIETSITRPRPAENFFESGFGDFLLARGVHFSGYSKSSLFVDRIRKGNPILRITRMVREQVRKLIENKYLTEEHRLTPEGQMLEALLLGDRGRLSPELREDLLRAGVFHLFAISGAHIGILALLAMMVLRERWFRERTRYISLMTVLVLFLFLTGFKISAERAVIMAVLLSLARMVYFRTDLINLLSFTGLILLIANPCSFLDPGFNLTFLVTAGIISGRNLFFRNKGTKNSALKEAGAANLNAAFCSIPLSLRYFMRYSFMSPLSGMVLIPVTAAVLCASIPLFLLSFLPLIPASVPLFLPDLLLKLFFFLTGSLARGINLSVFHPPPPPVLTTLFYVLFFSACWSGSRGFIKYPSLLLTALFLFLILKPIPRYNPEHPEIYFLDVGQGDCHVVVPPGGDALLIDGGGSRFGDFEVGKQVVLPFILRKGIRVRWVAVTHYHPDHCRGINELIEILRPEEVWISSRPDYCPLYTALTALCERVTKLRMVQTGFRLRSKGVLMEVLYPFRELNPFSTKNDHSQVIRISYGPWKVLFTGDIEGPAEKKISSKYGMNLQCDILKVPHHGSGTSSTREFLNLCRPETAVFPLGFRNSFGFPDPVILSRYRRINCRLLFTSGHGGIMARLSPEGIRFKVSRFSAGRSVNF